MTSGNKEYVENQGMTRRDFLWITSVSVAGIAVGCAVNPVTGQKQLMLMSESQEIANRILPTSFPQIMAPQQIKPSIIMCSKSGEKWPR